MTNLFCVIESRLATTPPLHSSNPLALLRKSSLATDGSVEASEEQAHNSRVARNLESSDFPADTEDITVPYYSGDRRHSS